MGSLTGVVASKSVTEAPKGALMTIGNRQQSVMAEGRLTERQTSRSGAKAEHSDPAVPHGRAQGLGCSPIKVARELGSERRETVRSLSIVGVGNLRGSDISTRGPCWTDLRFTGCPARGTAGYPRLDRISAECI